MIRSLLMASTALAVAFAAAGGAGGGAPTPKLEDVLDRLDPNKDEHWTAEGLPAVKAVAELAENPEITRAEIDQAVGDRRRDNWNVSDDSGDSQSAARTGTAADTTTDNTGSTGGDAPAPDGVNRSPHADAAEAQQNERQGGPPNPNPDAPDPGTNQTTLPAPGAAEGATSGSTAVNDAQQKRTGAALAGDDDAETVTQRKQTLGEALTTGGANEIENIGQGSIEEEAPAVRGATVSEIGDRVVQQGDDVVIFTRNPINASLENRGKVQKINQDGTINVLVPRNNGARPESFSAVQNRNMGDGSPYWQFPAE